MENESGVDAGVRSTGRAATARGRASRWKEGTMVIRLISRFRSAPAPSKCWGCAAPGKDGQCPICGREQREAEAREKGEYARACDKAIGHSV